MKVPFAALLIVFSCLTSAHASQSGQVSIGKNTLSQLLLQTVRSECQLPQQLHPYAEGLLVSFVQLAVEGKPMLATAFLKGFTGVDSQLLEEGYCVAAFMNVPRSEAWEPNLNLEASVRMLGQIPKHKLVYASDITEPPFELITFF